MSPFVCFPAANHSFEQHIMNSEQETIDRFEENHRLDNSNRIQIPLGPTRLDDWDRSLFPVFDIPFFIESIDKRGQIAYDRDTDQPSVFMED